MVRVTSQSGGVHKQRQITSEISENSSRSEFLSCLICFLRACNLVLQEGSDRYQREEAVVAVAL
ncbi:unnamed protein product [Musa acuminata subsp. burmannicoides]